MSERVKPPNDREGFTKTFRLNEVSLQVTVNFSEDGNPIEIFAKCNNGMQGHVETACIAASMALQYGCPVGAIASKWAYRRYAPEGTIGQPKSIADALAIALYEAQKGEMPDKKPSVKEFQEKSAYELKMEMESKK